jgi:Ni/Co efflux regulator RcnB
MRKILFSLLLATAAASPAFAAPRDSDDRPTREERKAERSESRQQKSEAREDRSQARDEARTERVDRRNTAVESVTPRERPALTVRRPANVNERGRAAVNEQAAARQQTREARRESAQDSRNNWIQQADRARDRARAPANARPDRPAPPPPTASSRHSSPTWHTSWRNDNRYDWRRWRDRNRSRFHLGVYLDPFGWGYHRWNIGWRLWPSFYSSNYWLDDPYAYRLPYAPWPYKWVRYYDDAILVNTYTGQVADVIYDFFW